jgi:general secretion pathway protein G
MSKQHGRHGFTLLELLVTATIIAVLTMIGVVSYSSVNKRSRDVKRKSDLEQIRSALEMYRSDQAEYPLTLDVLVTTYIPAIPTDPNTNSYYYQPIQNGAVYNAYCVCAKLETATSTQSTCTITLPESCNYGLKNP